MRVVVVGSGAVGLSYGARLLEAEVLTKARPDLDVQFVARRDHQYLRRHGFTMRSPDGHLTFSPHQLKGKVHTTAYDAVCDGTGVDWVLCCVKAYALKDSELRASLSALVGPRTRILLVMNGLMCERVMCDWFGAHRVSVGMAFTCVQRHDPYAAANNNNKTPFALVHHTAFGALQIGHSKDDVGELAHVLDLWRGTTIEHKVTTTDSLRRTQWTKLAWNVPFSGLSVALGGVTTDVIANGPHFRRLADRIMRDTISLANADLSHQHSSSSTPPSSSSSSSSSPSAKLLDAQAVREYCWSLTDGMGAYRPSTAIDLNTGRELETEFIFNEPLAQARLLTQLRRGVTPGKPAVAEAMATDWPHVEAVVDLVNGVATMADLKRRK